ncbi:MAG: ATP-binding cassette domain-containing protein [Sphaerochaetaceae bacterium]|jgi:oligopeptide transport system ATP-binding protein
MQNKEPLLRVEHLCQYFRMEGGELKAVDDINFQINKGEVFGLVGESGCGKTTTGRTIIKLYEATSGSVYFNGIRITAGTRSYEDAIRKARADYQASLKALDKSSPDYASKKESLSQALKAAVASNREQIKSARTDTAQCDKAFAKKKVEEAKAYHKAHPEQSAKEYSCMLRKARKARVITSIQMIFQDPIASLDPRMTVREIIAEGLIIQGEKDQELITQKVNEMLEMVGLVAEHASRYPHEFSGGQRQRIGVARSIIMNPDLIIADEPVSALDVSIQAQVINLLNDLRKKFGLTLLFIAHDLSVVKYFSDRIGVMYYGNMVELASSDELFKHPLHPYTKSLLSAIPLPDPIYEKSRKRITYNPLLEHDYSTDKPSFREISKGHFVKCNDAEFEKYKRELN